MTIQTATVLKNYFTGGSTPTTAQFEDVIDTAIRDPLIAIATAGENGLTGALHLTATAVATAHPVGTVGVQYLATGNTAAAASIIPTINEATTAQVQNNTVASGAFIPPGLEKFDPSATKGYGATPTLGGITLAQRVSSITRTQSGVSVVKWARAMPTANYIVIGMPSMDSISDATVLIMSLSASAQAQTVSGFTYKTYESIGTLQGPDRITSFAAFCSGA